MNGRGGARARDAELARAADEMVATLRRETAYDFDLDALPFAFRSRRPGGAGERRGGGGDGGGDGGDGGDGGGGGDDDARARHSLTYHAEKKALAALLLIDGGGARGERGCPRRLPPARVDVNIRMCADCHACFAHASRYYARELVCVETQSRCRHEFLSLIHI